MTLQDFRDDLVKAYTDVLGQPYLEGTAQNDAINRALERFTEDTYCLYDDDVSFTTSSSIGHYDMRDTTVFGQKMLRVLRVWVDGVLIRQVATQRDMVNLESLYIYATPDTPKYWFTQGTSQLVLYPKPDSTYSDTYVSGWYLHPTLSDETEELVIPDSDLEAAAIECALALMHPRAAGSAKEHVLDLRQELEQAKAKIKARSGITDAPVVTQRRGTRIFGLN